VAFVSPDVQLLLSVAYYRKEEDMKIEKMVQPESLDDAYSALLSHDKALLMAGGVFLRLQKRINPLVIDLSDLPLDYIKTDSEVIRIGAMTSLREIEQAEILPKAISQSTRQIGGVGLRNLVTIGGSVCGRYGFSDITTALLAVEAHLSFYKAGEISLLAYLEKGEPKKDILIEVIVPRNIKSSFRCFKSVYTDFSLINVAVSYDEKWKVAIGARPGRAVLVKANEIESLDIHELIAPVQIEDDVRSHADYRRSLAETLISEAIEEVSEWK